MKWLAQNNPCEITPLDDLKPHESGMGCWCRPLLDDGVIVHNSLDGRERTYEKGITQ